MAHALGEMYYLANLMEERQKQAEQQNLEKEKQGQGPQTVHSGLVFISPRVPKEFDTVVPSDMGKPVDSTVDSTVDRAVDSCVIM